ncbi:mitochondrial FAD carrier protein flx1 [Diatrype stigma]|uniref:Mitochondrial FAD carrier protein flx1 n=1 Tax=Diatrype stigma TaxID=117547 RepID=A0AAN9YL74_9PEZI
MTPNHEGLSPALIETIAGLSAGSVATLLVHPLDIVKTRMQIHRSRGGVGTAAAEAAARSTSLTTVSVLRELMRTPHPFAALYRGLTPNLLGSASSWASFFFFKARAERAIVRLKSGGGGSSSDASSSSLTPQDYFVASAVGGLFTQCLTNPIWVLKTRMLSSDRGAAGAYPSMWAGAARILRAEGWRGFYRGLGISLFGVTHGAVQFAVYDPLKKMYLRRRNHLDFADGGDQGMTTTTTTTGGMQQQQRLGNEVTLVISSVSKLVAGAVTYPYQVIRSRLQNYNADERFGRGIRGVVRRTWGEEGWRGFYRGIIPGVVRVLPATWVTFLVYENVKYYLPQWFAPGGWH